MQRILAIDFGLKRCGLAITDENNRIALGLTTVTSDKLMEVIKQLIQKENVGVIVLGYPARMDGSDSHVTENVRQLKKIIEQKLKSIQVELHDERFTSKMASQTIVTSGISKKKRKQKGLIDTVSATLILQSYLEEKA